MLTQDLEVRTSSQRFNENPGDSHSTAQSVPGILIHTSLRTTIPGMKRRRLLTGAALFLTTPLHCSSHLKMGNIKGKNQTKIKKIHLTDRLIMDSQQITIKMH